MANQKPRSLVPGTAIEFARTCLSKNFGQINRRLVRRAALRVRPVLAVADLRGWLQRVAAFTAAFGSRQSFCPARQAVLGFIVFDELAFSVINGLST